MISSAGIQATFRDEILEPTNSILPSQSRRKAAESLEYNCTG